MVFSDLFFLFVFLPLFGLSYLLAGWADKLTLPDRQTAVRERDRLRSVRAAILDELEREENALAGAAGDMAALAARRRRMRCW